MYLLKFYGRDELEQMKISDNKTLLEIEARKEIDGDLSFRQMFDMTFIICKDREIGIIGPIEELK